MAQSREMVRAIAQSVAGSPAIEKSLSRPRP